MARKTGAKARVGDAAGAAAPGDGLLAPAGAAWPTVWLAPADLTPYPQNPRDNERAIAAVAASIEAFGFRQPIVVDSARVIVVGDTRWRASQRFPSTPPAHGSSPDDA
jgi:hypothetical protein